VHARRYANMDEVVENTAEDGQLFMHARWSVICICIEVKRSWRILWCKIVNPNTPLMIYVPRSYVVLRPSNGFASIEFDMYRSFRHRSWQGSSQRRCTLRRHIPQRETCICDLNHKTFAQRT
jgi:hypothetical protein